MSLIPVSPSALRLVTAIDESPTANSLESAFRTYSSFVAAVAYRILGRQSEVEDVVHDVFLAAYRKLPASTSEARAWLTVVTVRVAKRRLKRRRLKAWLHLDEAPEEVATESSPYHQALLAQVFRALDGLPADERLAWSLRHLQGEPLEAVATACGCSLATVKRRIAVAQAFLKEALGDE